MATLQMQKIPTMMKIRGAGQYLSLCMGFTYFSKEIYVPSHLEVEAREILDRIIGENTDTFQDSSFDEPPDIDDFNNLDESESYKRISNKRLLGRIIIAATYFGLPVVILLFALLLSTLLSN